MSMYPQSNKVTLDYSTTRDLSIPKFFNQVYAWMCVGLAVTAVTAFLAQGFMIHSPLVLVAAFLGLTVLGISTQAVTMRVSAGAGLAMFLLYAAIIGVISSWIFVVYRIETLMAAFAVTAGTFAGVSAVGFFTKIDLSRAGGFIIMAIWGVFLASVVNLFVASTAFSWFITYAVLALFIGYTAYFTQNLRDMAIAYKDSPQMLQRLAVIGSLQLYVSFLNMFFSILRIMGNRR